MIGEVFAWFMGTKIGRGIGMALAIVALTAVAYWRVFSAGKASERVAQERQSARNIQTRSEVHDEVASKVPADRRRELDGWVRPD